MVLTQTLKPLPGTYVTVYIMVSVVNGVLLLSSSDDVMMTMKLLYYDDSKCMHPPSLPPSLPHSLLSLIQSLHLNMNLQDSRLVVIILLSVITTVCTQFHFTNTIAYSEYNLTTGT